MCMRKPENFDSKSHFDYLERLVKGEMTEEDKEEFINHYMWMIFDNSPSMIKRLEAVRAGLRAILEGLASKNKASSDFRTLVKLALFNSQVEEFNEVHFEPDQLLNSFSDSDYKCHGSTSMGAVYEYMNKELSRSKPWVAGLKKNTPRFTFTLCTDAEINDAVSLREEAKKLLESNRFFRDYVTLLVIFLGDESNKPTAVAIAGGHEEHVITLDDDMLELLSPVVINSTVNLIDGTHVNSANKPSMSDTTKEARERKEEGSRSASSMIDKNLEDEFRRLMGLA